MTAKELIAALQELDGDTPVKMVTYGHVPISIDDVTPRRDSFDAWIELS